MPDSATCGFKQVGVIETLSLRLIRPLIRHSLPLYRLDSGVLQHREVQPIASLDRRQRVGLDPIFEQA